MWEVMKARTMMSMSGLAHWDVRVVVVERRVWP